MKKKAKRPVKKAVKKVARVAKRAAKKVVRKAKKVAARSSRAPKAAPAPNLNGWITHTDFGSSNPQETRAWCAKVLGWAFRPKIDMPGGEYHMFAYSDLGGGGIHPLGPSEPPGAIPYVHVADVRAAFDKAIMEGADPVMQPERIMGDITIGVVRAPGGVKIGFAGP